MSSLMLPPARPLRLNVHILPAEASNNMQIEPTRRFIQVTPQSKTLQRVCYDISKKHSRAYGGALTIKKCQIASGSDVDLEYKVSDVFDDHDVIRIIQAPVSIQSPFTREDSLFPDSILRPKPQQSAGYKRGRSRSTRSSSRHGRANSEAPNKKRRVHDPDEPMRSLERDDDETTLLDGLTSPLLQVSDSQHVGIATTDQGQTNGILDVRHSNDYRRSLSPISAYPRLRSFQEIENDQTDFQFQSAQGSQGNQSSPRDLESPSNSLNVDSLLGNLPGLDRFRSGSEISSRHGDDSSQRSAAGRQRRSGSARHTLHVENATGRDRSLSTAQTTPLISLVLQTPNERRSGSVARRSVSVIPKNSSDDHAGVNVYNAIGTDIPPRSGSTTGLATEEAEETTSFAEKVDLQMQRKCDEENTANQQQEADATEERERAAAKAKRLEQARLDAEQRTAAIAEEGKRKEIEAQRLAEEQKGRELAKEREAEQKRLQAAEEVAAAEKAADAARKESKKAPKPVQKAVDEAAKLAEDRRQVSGSPDSGTPKGSSAHAINTPVGPPGSPLYKSMGDRWIPELDDVLFAARSTGQGWLAIRDQHFPDLSTKRLKKGHEKVSAVRGECIKMMKGQNAIRSSSETRSHASPASPRTPASSKSRRESSTAPILSNGKVIKNIIGKESSQAVAISSPHPPSDSNDSQTPPSSRRRVSFAKNQTPTSGQTPVVSSAVSTKPYLISGKETDVPSSRSSQSQSKGETLSSYFKPKQTPIPAPARKFSSEPVSRSLKQTKLVSPRLGITDVKATFKVSPVNTRILRPKPALKTPIKTAPAKKQAKLAPDSNVSDKVVSQPIIGSQRRILEKSGRSGSRRDTAPANGISGVGEDDDEKFDSGNVQKVTERSIATGRSGVPAKSSKLPMSRGQYETRGSRSPVAFMSQHSTVIVSAPISMNRENSWSPGSSPPILNIINDMGIDDQRTDSDSDSENDDADGMDLDEAPVKNHLPAKKVEEEHSIDDQLQSQARPDSSQRESWSSKHQSSFMLPPKSNRPPTSAQFPSLVEMSRARPQRLLVAESEAAKRDKAEKETESDELSEYSDASSTDSDDDEVNANGKARHPGAVAGKKPRKRKAISFTTIQKILGKNPSQAGKR